jgi:isoquinoline 1-oxidoreductase alpha subunit
MDGKRAGWPVAEAAMERSAMVRLIVNDTQVDIEGPPNKPLLWALREDVGLNGPKYGCGVAQCGACRVLIDGVSTPSCVVALGDVEGATITTIEGLTEDDGRLSVVQQAWIDEQVPQCGFCQPGFIVAATALLASNPNPSDADIDAAITNICRCGTYPRIRRAIHRAASQLAS